MGNKKIEELTPEQAAQRIKEAEQGFENLKHDNNFSEKYKKFADRYKGGNETEQPFTEQGEAYVKKVNSLQVGVGGFNIASVMNKIKQQEIQGKRFGRKPVNIPFDDAKKILYRIGVHKYGAYDKETGKGFRFDEHNADIYRDMLLYFLGKPGAYDLKKGFFIYGDVGRGKSAFFNIFQTFADVCEIKHMNFKIASCMDIPFEVAASEGVSTLKKYFKGVYAFDDLGQEEPVYKLFGNNIHVTEEILTQRYNNFIKSGLLTFVTSNYPRAAMLEKYGARMDSRFKEMFNVVELKGVDRRK